VLELEDVLLMIFKEKPSDFTGEHFDIEVEKHKTVRYFVYRR
jgi:hypothetical protein